MRINILRRIKQLFYICIHGTRKVREDISIFELSDLPESSQKYVFKQVSLLAKGFRVYFAPNNRSGPKAIDQQRCNIHVHVGCYSYSLTPQRTKYVNKSTGTKTNMQSDCKLDLQSEWQNFLFVFFFDTPKTKIKIISRKWILEIFQVLCLCNNRTVGIYSVQYYFLSKSVKIVYFYYLYSNFY